MTTTNQMSVAALLPFFKEKWPTEDPKDENFLIEIKWKRREMKRNEEKMSLEKFLDQGDDGVDPRVQIELERLNSATVEINRLEVQLDEARDQFRQLLQESTSRLETCAKKLGSCIVKVKPYYDARIKAKQALQETQKAAVTFERANSAHAAAKEMVFLAEEGLKAEGRTFDHAWQEMLNHATMRVNESESERTLAEAEHKRTSQNYQLAEMRVRSLQKELKRAITKSRPYFELKIHYTQLLEKQKQNVKDLEKQVTDVKMSYAEALKNLERISDEIHKVRQKNKQPSLSELGKRSEGVGAESDSPNEFSSLYSLTKPKSGQGKQTENKTRHKDRGLNSETGKDIVSPVSESSYQTLTSKSSVSSQPETDIWSEGSTDVGNVKVSPSSDSSLTGPPDTESEDELFNFPQNPNCLTTIDSTPSLSVEDFNKKKESENVLFEGVGICSFPVPTELNLKFEGETKEEKEVTGTDESHWTEIKLSSPEEEIFSTVKVVNSTKSELEEEFNIPYAPLSEVEDVPNVNHSDDSPVEKKSEFILCEKNGMLCGVGEKTEKKETNEGEDLNSKSLRGTPRKINLRRQSLDVLWNNTAGEKMKEILSQSIMKLNIGSLTERRSIDSRMCEANDFNEDEPSINSVKENETNYESNLSSQFGINFFNRKNSKVEDDYIQTIEEKKSNNDKESISTQLGGLISRKERFSFKKVPSPLEKTLNYLNADEESNSDNESLASSDMFTDEQLSSLVLDRDLAEIYQDIL